MSLHRAALIVLLVLSVTGMGSQQPQTNLGSDANGNPLRRAIKTGHVSNYDEAKVKRAEPGTG